MILERILITNIYRAISADPKKRLTLISSKSNSLLVRDNKSKKLHEIEITYKKGWN